MYTLNTEEVTQQEKTQETTHPIRVIIDRGCILLVNKFYSVSYFRLNVCDVQTVKVSD